MHKSANCVVCGTRYFVISLIKHIHIGHHTDYSYELIARENKKSKDAITRSRTYNEVRLPIEQSRMGTYMELATVIELD